MLVGGRQASSKLLSPDWHLVKGGTSQVVNNRCGWTCKDVRTTLHRPARHTLVYHRDHVTAVRDYPFIHLWQGVPKNAAGRWWLGDGGGGSTFLYTHRLKGGDAYPPAPSVQHPPSKEKQSGPSHPFIKIQPKSVSMVTIIRFTLWDWCRCVLGRKTML